jgi:hypothetical protein
MAVSMGQNNPNGIAVRLMRNGATAAGPFSFTTAGPQPVITFILPVLYNGTTDVLDVQIIGGIDAVAGDSITVVLG